MTLFECFYIISNLAYLTANTLEVIIPPIIKVNKITEQIPKVTASDIRFLQNTLFVKCN